MSAKANKVAVHSMDRLARSLVDLRRTVEELTAKGVRVRFVKEGLTFGDTSNPCNELMLTIMAAVAEFERAYCWSASARASRSQRRRASTRAVCRR